MEWIWLGVIIALLLVEFISMNYTAIWFVLSSVISYILLKLGQDYSVQVICFLGIGILGALFIRTLIIDKLLVFRDEKVLPFIDRFPILYKIVALDKKRVN